MSDLDLLFNSLKTENTNKHNKNLETCDNCNNTNLINNNGTMICQDCGNINCNIIDSNPEWRY